MEAQEMGRRIRMIRVKVGMSVRELAERAGLSPSAVSLIERGKREVEVRELANIAVSLGISPLAILEPASLLARLPPMPGG